MAFKKTITLPTGDSGEYITINYYHWDKNKKEASFHFALYKTEGHYRGGSLPQRQIIAKLRLNGTDYEQWMSSTAMSKVKGKTHMDQAYAAARAGVGLVSDWHTPHTAVPLFGADALDVLEPGQQP